MKKYSTKQQSQISPRNYKLKTEIENNNVIQINGFDSRPTVDETRNSSDEKEVSDLKDLIQAQTKEIHNIRKEIIDKRCKTLNINDQIRRMKEEKNYQNRINDIWRIKMYHLKADKADVYNVKKELNLKLTKKQSELDQLQKEYDKLLELNDSTKKEIDSLEKNEKCLMKCDLIIGNMRSEYNTENRLLMYKLNLSRQAVHKLKTQSDEKRLARIQNRKDLNEINQTQCKLNWKCEGLLAHNLDRKQHHDTLNKQVLFIEKELTRTNPKFHMLSNKVDLMKSKALRNDIKMKLQISRIEKLINERMQRVRTENLCRNQVPMWTQIINDLQQKIDEVRKQIYLNICEEHKEKSLAQSRLKECKILELYLGQLQTKMLSQHRLTFQNEKQLKRLHVISSILQSKITGVEKQLFKATDEINADIEILRNDNQ